MAINGFLWWDRLWWINIGPEKNKRIFSASLAFSTSKRWIIFVIWYRYVEAWVRTYARCKLHRRYPLGNSHISIHEITCFSGKPTMNGNFQSILYVELKEGIRLPSSHHMSSRGNYWQWVRYVMVHHGTSILGRDYRALKDNKDYKLVAPWVIPFCLHTELQLYPPNQP